VLLEWQSRIIVNTEFLVVEREASTLKTEKEIDNTDVDIKEIDGEYVN
jgi:hypothetical protein